jgi:hypothetical protein
METMFYPQGVLAFYGFAIPTPPVINPEHHSASLPHGVQFVLNTLPVSHVSYE